MRPRNEGGGKRRPAPAEPQRSRSDFHEICEAVFGESPLATAVTECDRHVVRYLNAAWLDLLGTDPDGLGRPFVERFPALVTVEPALLDRVCRTGEPARLADLLYKLSQGDLWLTVTAWPWGRPTSGRRLTVVQIIETATFARGRMDEITREMRAINERLLLTGVRERDLSSRRAELLAGAEEASRAKSTFISTMSHELRTPLNALMGYVDLLAEGVAGPVTQKQTEMLGRVKFSALHLLDLIQQILTFSRTEAGQMKAQAEPVDAVALAREAALLVQPLIHEKGLTFTLHAPDDRIRLETDPGLLKQILVNLLNNAMKFTDAGEICLDIAQDGKDLYCTVRDTGIGIAPDQIERIFEPFHQVLRVGKQPLEGTGLGLTVSRRLARLLGGDLTVESKLGEGSRFTVRCPLRTPLPPRQPD